MLNFWTARIAFGASLPVILLALLVWSVILSPLVLLLHWGIRSYKAHKRLSSELEEGLAVYEGRSITRKLHMSAITPRVTEDELI